MSEQENKTTNIYYNVHIEGDAVGVVIGSGTINANNIAGGNITQQTIAVSSQFVYANVPTMPNHFVGRDAQIAQLVTQLTTSQTLALSADGLPGVGKTTMAVALAHHGDILRHFNDGVLWGGLGTHPDPMRILGEWGTALGHDLSHLPTPEQRQHALQNILGNKKILLMLDDAWQAEPAQFLRCGGPNCAHLLTTRDKGIARTFAGPNQMNNIETLPLADGVTLLQQLAPEACTSNPAMTEKLVQTVGGLPLAIELLGGYLADPNAPERLYVPDEMAQAFDDLTIAELRLQLASERLGSHAGNTSLQATIELSLADLPPTTQTAFYCLGAFAPKPATFSWDAAKAVTEANNRQLATLIERNLLEPDGQWLALHQLLADVAKNYKEANEAATRHRTFYLDLVNQDRYDWQTIESEFDQIKHAWPLHNNHDLLEFYLSIFDYLDLRGLRSIQLKWSFEVLNSTLSSENFSYRGKLLRNISKIYFEQGNLPFALDKLIEAKQVFITSNDLINLGEILIDMGFIYNQWDDHNNSLQCFQSAAESFSEANAKDQTARAFYLIGMILTKKNQIREAIEHCLDASKIAIDPIEKAQSFTILGDIFWGINDLDQALDFHLKALKIFEQANHSRGISRGFIGIAGIYREQKQSEIALQYLQKALEIHKIGGDISAQASTLNYIGIIYNDLKLKETAAQYFLDSLNLCENNIYALQERLTRFNLYLYFKEKGNLNLAIFHLEKVVDLEKIIQHPNLEDHSKLLSQLLADLAVQN